MSSDDPLSSLRDAIAEIDRTMLELLRRRMELAAEVGRLKAGAGTPVVVRDVEDRVLERARELGVKVYTLHPMFGPGKSYYETLTFVLATQGDPAEEKREIAAFLTHPYTRLVAVPFPHHDRLMGWLLGLAHLSNILFGATIAQSGVEPEELHACASTTFNRQAATALNVLAEDPDLYLDIQNLNPHGRAVSAATREALGQIERLVEARDREGFQELMNAARRALTREP